MGDRERMRAIGRNDADYPQRMKVLGNMPELLYVIGDLPDDGFPSVAVVGARKCTVYGYDTAYAFGRALASHGVQIVSGMAAGIDGCAQTGALDGGGKTFAVLGSGADVCYPRSNAKLYERILRAGGILSEQPPGTQPVGYHFPARNRIISALADIVLVVEAGERSGSLITVEFALNQGKTVYAVPGRIGDRLSDGCNALISDGAGIAVSPESILNEIRRMQDTLPFGSRRKAACPRMHVPFSPHKSRTAPPQKPERAPLPQKVTATLSAQARAALRVFSEDEERREFTAEDILSAAGLSFPEISSALMELTLAGIAEETARGHFRLK